MANRQRLEILAEILRAVKELRHDGQDHIPPSRIAAKVYVSYDRFRQYVAIARECGLIDSNNFITDRGEKYLSLFRGVEELLGHTRK